ncbi:MAG: hypothetical protein RMX96_31675 [Nostoc sp. ChiSLP02]|nr:hypothetical protein [Nostoc sp. DedSLP05]MDZ8100983.1 hypothetical protein [Nostoc sp. DedSLP01]MDZ8189384.1 hypothetical protein [Nostoc sp. ChiSLP02]
MVKHSKTQQNQGLLVLSFVPQTNLRLTLRSLKDKLKLQPKWVVYRRTHRV